MDDAEHRQAHRDIHDKLDDLQERINLLILAAAATLASVTLGLAVLLIQHLMAA